MHLTNSMLDSRGHVLPEYHAELAACEWIDACVCTGLTSLPDLPACKWLYCDARIKVGTRFAR